MGMVSCAKSFYIPPNAANAKVTQSITCKIDEVNFYGRTHDGRREEYCLSPIPDDTTDEAKWNFQEDTCEMDVFNKHTVAFKGDKVETKLDSASGDLFKKFLDVLKE